MTTLVTSRLAAGATLVSAALTPVIVAVVKELLRRPATKISDPAAPRRACSPRRWVAQRGDRRPHEGRELACVGAPPHRRTHRLRDESSPFPRSGPPDQREPWEEPSYRVYRHRRKRWRLALATGLAGFAVCVVAFTPGELALGGAVDSGRSTTFFGGGSGGRSSQNDSRSKEEEKSRDDEKSKDPKEDDATSKDASTPPTPRPDPSLRAVSRTRRASDAADARIERRMRPARFARVVTCASRTNYAAPNGFPRMAEPRG